MNYYSGMICPVCENGKLEEKQKTLDFEYKGVNRKITDQRVFECNDCHEQLQNKKDLILLDRMLTDSRRSIDGLLVSNEIKSIREHFGLTQVEFAQALQVGAKNFARYESGHATQGRMTDNLLRILRDYPYTIRQFGVKYPKDQDSVVYKLKATIYPPKKAIKVSVISTECLTEEGNYNACQL